MNVCVLKKIHCKSTYNLSGTQCLVMYVYVCMSVLRPCKPMANTKKITFAFNNAKI